MSALLDEIIADRKAKAIEYEEYLKGEEGASGAGAGNAATLDTPGKRAFYNNLKMAGGAIAGGTGVAEPGTAYAVAGDQAIELALKIDATVRQVRPDDWRGVQAREQVIKAALYGVLQEVAEVERIFLIVKAQREY
jgi:type I restriction enzyme, R subunit